MWIQIDHFSNIAKTRRQSEYKNQCYHVFEVKTLHVKFNVGTQFIKC